MRKEILLKYVSGEASYKEEQDILLWAAKDKANELYLARLKNVWISQNMPQKRASMEQVDKMMRIIGGSSGKISSDSEKKVYIIKKQWFWSAAACVLIFLCSGIYMFTSSIKGGDSLSNPQNIIGNLITYKNHAPQKVLYTEKGVKAKVVLPDSSVVWLNSDTKIEYPDKFDSLVRNVTISGEAYFDVVKNPHRPMIVKTTKGFSVQVLGTTFNLKAYEDDAKSQATLYSGEINLLRESGNKVITTKVLPFQTVTINSNDVHTPVRKVLKQSPLDDAAWKEGKIIFEETPMSEVVKVLERWHGVDFEVKDEQILGYKITAMFNSESIVQIMDLIQMTSLVSYKIDNKKVILSKK